MNKATRIKVWEKYNKRCAYCGCELEYKDMQVDHIESRYYGGSDDIENLNPSCRMCNFYKQENSVEFLRKQLGLIVGRLQKVFIFRLAVKYGLIEITEKPIRFYFERKSRNE